MATTLDVPRLYSAGDDHRPVTGSTVWAVAHPIGEAPAGPDQRWVLIMGEVTGVRLDTPDWPHGQVWSTAELCREYAWSRRVVGSRHHRGFDILRLDVVTPTLFRIAAR